MNNDKQDQGNSPNPDSLKEISSTLMAEVLRRAEPLGWDQPAMLYFIRVEPIEEGYAGIGLQVAAVLEGHPFEAMLGLKVPDDVSGLVVMTEGWMTSNKLGVDPVDQAPLDSLSPPTKVEVRITQTVWRDGTERCVIRPRDGVETISDSMAGRILHGLRCGLGLPSGAQLEDLASVRQRAVVDHLVRLAENESLAELLQLGSSPEAVFDGLPRPFDSLRLSDWPDVAFALGVNVDRDDDRWDALAGWADAELLSNELADAVPSAHAISNRIIGVLETATYETTSALSLALHHWI